MIVVCVGGEGVCGGRVTVDQDRLNQQYVFKDWENRPHQWP